MVPRRKEPGDSSAGSVWENVARAIFGEQAKRSGKRQLVVGCFVLVLQFLLSGFFWHLDLGSYLNLTLGLMFVLTGGGTLLYPTRRTLANVLRLAATLTFAAMLFLLAAIVIGWTV
jgi:hypothetical protein